MRRRDVLATVRTGRPLSPRPALHRAVTAVPLRHQRRPVRAPPPYTIALGEPSRKAGSGPRRRALAMRAEDANELSDDVGTGLRWSKIRRLILLSAGCHFLVLAG